MRLWLNESDRRPDPEPLATPDRRVILAGLALWLVATIALIAALPALTASGLASWLWVGVCGLVVGGLLLLAVTLRKR